jgi:hypothetical protein
MHVPNKVDFDLKERIPIRFKLNQRPSHVPSLMVADRVRHKQKGNKNATELASSVKRVNKQG